MQPKPMSTINTKLWLSYPFFLFPFMQVLHCSASASTLSSPPSSPGLFIDSSPASSPSLDPIQLDSSLDFENFGKLADPFAGSFNSTRSPPQYEKRQKRRGTIVPPPAILKRPRRHQDMSNEEHHFDECMPLPLYLQPCPGREKTAHEKEAEEWDRLEEDIYNLQMRVVDIS